MRPPAPMPASSFETLADASSSGRGERACYDAVKLIRPTGCFLARVTSIRLITARSYIGSWRRRRSIRRGGLETQTASGEPLQHRAHGISGLAVLHGVEQRGCGLRAAEQALGIGEDQRIVPRALHHEGQVEAG